MDNTLKTNKKTCYGCKKEIVGEMIYVYGWLCIECYEFNYKGTFNHDLYQLRKLTHKVWVEVKKAFTN